MGKNTLSVKLNFNLTQPFVLNFCKYSNFPFWFCNKFLCVCFHVYFMLCTYGFMASYVYKNCGHVVVLSQSMYVLLILYITIYIRPLQVIP